MRVVKQYQPFLQEYGQWRTYMGHSLYDFSPVFGERLYKIFFDDLGFDTPAPVLPLWYRIILWWGK